MKSINQKNNILYDGNFPKMFFFVTLMFIPKIDIVHIPGYWQGIRLDDILIFCFFISYVIQVKNLIYHSNMKFRGFIIFFIYIIISNLFAIFSGIDVKFLMLIRFSEYIVLIYFFDNFKIDLKTLKKIIYLFLIINLIIAFLQYWKIIGSISSVGYLDSDHFLSSRSSGLTGGSWELGMLSSLSFFIIHLIEKDYKKLALAFIVTNTLLILAAGRANFVAFNFACFFLYLFNNKIYFFQKLLLFIFILTSILTIKFFYIGSLFEKIFLIDPQYLFTIFYEAIFNDNLIERDELKDIDVYLSFWYRVVAWKMFIDQVIENSLNIFFGLGFNMIYFDSLMIRIFVSHGLLGILIILILSLRINLYLLVFFIISGTFLDLFISMKIYFFTLVLVYVITHTNSNLAKKL